MGAPLLYDLMSTEPPEKIQAALFGDYSSWERVRARGKGRAWEKRERSCFLE